MKSHASMSHMEHLQHLVTHGWTSLTGLAEIMGISVSSVQARQRGPHSVPTIKIGSTQRVAKEDAIRFIRDSRDRDRAKYVLYVLERIELRSSSVQRSSIGSLESLNSRDPTSIQETQ